MDYMTEFLKIYWLTSLVPALAPRTGYTLPYFQSPRRPTHTSSAAEPWPLRLAASRVDVAWREGSGSRSCTGPELAGAAGCGRRLLTWHHTDTEGQTCPPICMHKGKVLIIKSLNN